MNTAQHTAHGATSQPHNPAGLPDPDSPIFTSFGKALLRQMQQSITTTTRTITYDYDGLQRLTSASENPGTTQTYSYDLAGNRTGVWMNGTRTQNLSYNAANQVNGWSYDAVGNLLNDGTTAYTYDALGRVLSVGATSNSYNADGTLVAQTQGSTTTRYVQDLAAPLSQILSDGTQRYVYGNPAERLYAQQGSSARTWYSTDALGSVRATLNDAGIPQAAASYDAWGVPQSSAIAPFGFTGELQRGSDVWLRARWYGAGRGAFGGRDPFEGFAQQPYSMQYYQYGYANPVSLRDPSGRSVQIGTTPRVFLPQSPAPLGIPLGDEHPTCPYIFDQYSFTREAYLEHDPFAPHQGWKKDDIASALKALLNEEIPKLQGVITNDPNNKPIMLVIGSACSYIAPKWLTFLSDICESIAGSLYGYTPNPQALDTLNILVRELSVFLSDASATDTFWMVAQKYGVCSDPLGCDISYEMHIEWSSLGHERNYPISSSVFGYLGSLGMAQRTGTLFIDYIFHSPPRIDWGKALFPVG